MPEKTPSDVSLEDIERFWAKVNKTEHCWLWTASTDRKGYGQFSCGSKYGPAGRRNTMRAAHRFSFFLANGYLPGPDSPGGGFVLHRCDTPACVNPEHLFIGTNLDNVRDMDGKGRRSVSVKLGSDHPNSVLTEADVREIARRHYDDGVSQAQLSREYRVSTSTVNHIFTGRLWGHLGLSKSNRKELS